MSRRGDQLSVTAALVGLTAIVAVVAGIIALADALLATVQTLPPLPAPAFDPESPCPVTGQATEPLAVTSPQLIECPDSYDGLRVRFEGEVVGAVLRRGERAWLQLNDDLYALAGPLPEHRTPLGANSGLAVSVPVATAIRVDAVGGHHARGDRVAVIGEFRATDPADGGGPTIHAAEARILEPGHGVVHPPATPRLAVAGGLAALTLVAGGVAVWRVRGA